MAKMVRCRAVAAGVGGEGVVEEAISERIREATARGLPLGGGALRRLLEHQTGRCLEMRAPGRPPRNKERECEEDQLEIGNS